MGEDNTALHKRKLVKGSGRYNKKKSEMIEGRKR